MSSTTTDDIKMPDFWNLWAIEKEACPPSWHWVSLNARPKGFPAGFVKIEGAVMPLRDDGMPIWRARERGTEKTFFVNRKAFDAWKKAKALAEGRCCECWGFGKVVTCVSIHTGTTYKTCRKCGGSGLPAGPIDSNAPSLTASAGH